MIVVYDFSEILGPHRLMGVRLYIEITKREFKGAVLNEILIFFCSRVHNGKYKNNQIWLRNRRLKLRVV